LKGSFGRKDSFSDPILWENGNTTSYELASIAQDAVGHWRMEWNNTGSNITFAIDLQLWEALPPGAKIYGYQGSFTVSNAVFSNGDLDIDYYRGGTLLDTQSFVLEDYLVGENVVFNKAFTGTDLYQSVENTRLKFDFSNMSAGANTRLTFFNVAVYYTF